MPVPEQRLYDYAIIRVMPRVEREEFINAGVILSCNAHRFLKATIALDPDRLIALDPNVDLDMVNAHLRAIEKISAGDPDAGPIGQLHRRERFHWLVAPRSTMIQTSPVHTGHCTDPEQALAHLVDKMVR
ncbi:MAG: DUF3037 domain-containing protein [Bacteroidota bacterium]